MTGGGQHLPGGWIKRLPARAIGMMTECYRAQRRLAVLAASPDRYLVDAGLAPGTYQEFLFRTSGPLAHEPTAARRFDGYAVR
ncbi:MAG TPA: hypothetical protein VGF32_12970 [Streptosporangiaceae bacterium]|jgi:hypothetical protein